MPLTWVLLIFTWRFNMKFAQRRTVYVDLSNYCHLSKPGETIEVTEWTNGEGWDIHRENTTISLTMGELQAIQVLCNIPYPKG